MTSIINPHHTAARAKREPVDSFVHAAARLDGPRALRNPRLRKITDDLRRNKFELAETRLREESARRPDDADAIWLLALTVARLGRDNEAAALLARCLELLSDFAAARFELAKLLVRLHRYSEALGEVEELLAHRGSNAHLLQLKAAILGSIGDQHQSLAIREQLAADDPDSAECWIGYGDALRVTGQQEKSIVAYRRAIECRRFCGRAWWSLADMKTVRFSDSDLAAMETELNRAGTPAEDRLRLLFALGRAYEDRGDYARSFEHYAKANAIKRLRTDYNWEALNARVAVEKSLFTSEFLKGRSVVGCKAPDPIFVLGQPRSGSTLIEQILSSHSLVEAVGELPYVQDIARQLARQESPGGAGRYIGSLGALSPRDLVGTGESYLRSVQVHRRFDRPFFIDKNPANYQHIGLIQMILPHAKIIDARRHPAACCLSMFKQNFSRNNLRLNELGHVYRCYVESMSHFDRVLPGRIHRVFYEQMIANPEAEIRRLLDYLELPFEQECLRFHETERAIRTPSSEQVRRPISGDAAEHWRHFEPWLGPLFDSLGSVLTDYPRVPEELHR
jgi:tetratricopeptide (TPR) repeat protein